MPGLVPGIHVFFCTIKSKTWMDRDKHGHDVERAVLYFFLTYFCTRQFSVSATNTSSRALTAM
jgi:hypothetical protein